MKAFADFGSISSGTMRAEDLCDSFAWELSTLARRAGRIREFSDLIKSARTAPDDEVLSDLFDALEQFAPPYGYFGAHIGDGADYGFWLSETMPDDFDGLKVSDLSEVPRGYSGEVLHVNDHGNMTLYAFARGRAREVWGIV
jgi:hypothetical protein